MSLALATQSVNHALRSKQLYITLTPTGNYVTGGDTVDFSKLTAALGLSDALIGYPGTISNFSVISAPPGYSALLVKGTALTNWKLKVFQSAGFTPAGTIAKPSFTVKTGTILANGTMGLDADAASANVTGGTGITADRTLTTTSPVGVPAFTGTPVAAGAQSELPQAAYPAGVLAGTFVIMVAGPKGQI